MPLDRSKFSKIVGGITTPPAPTAPIAEPLPEPEPQPIEPPADLAAGQGSAPQTTAPDAGKSSAQPAKRFAKTGRPKGQATGKSTKTKVSLFIDKTLIDELYDWAYQDRIQPGELFERALRAYRDREIKRRNSGTE